MAIIPFHIVDAFADRPFTGNPAAIIPNASSLTEAEMLQITDELSMEAMNEGRECGACHAQGGRAFAMTACMTCHRPGVVVSDIVYRNEAMGDTTFSHSTHTGAGLECLLCHSHAFKMPKGVQAITMEGIHTRRQCGQCHNDDVIPFPATECVACHKKPSE